MKRRLKLGLLLIAIVLVGTLTWKGYAWSPYFQFFQWPQGHVEKLKVSGKLLLTIAFQQPSGTPKTIGNTTLITEDAASPGIVQLFKKYPPPQDVIEAANWQTKVEGLRAFVSNILPASTGRPASPEPVSALDLLALDENQEPYQKLCSKNALIFTQYLTGLGIPSRIVQLKNHVTTEIWNEAEQRWEIQDAYYDSAATYQGKPLSAIEAFDLLQSGEDIDFVASDHVFDQVIYIPRTDFSAGNLPDWNYFSFRNLYYWDVVRLSDEAHKFWYQLPIDQNQI